MIRYSPEHLWLRQDDATDQLLFTVGITVHAQETLGDIVFIDLPALSHRQQDQVIGIVESSKTAADLHMPVDGDIIEYNEALREQPNWLNDDPQGQGWIFKIRANDTTQFDALMDASSYKAFTG